MNTTHQLDTVGTTPAAAPAARPDDSGRTRAEVRRLAQEFEAMLLTQMLKDMRQSMVDADESSEFGPMTDTIDVELGRSLSAAGGFGLGAMLLQALDRLAGEPAAENRAAAGSDAARRDAVSGVAVALSGMAQDAAGGGAPSLAHAAPITSGYGWRRDPISGGAGFHAGVDLGVAYGQDIRAAAPGRVVFAGEKGGYGNMVSLVHADGRETRYAHLASLTVAEGDEVVEGQTVGQAGSSGRATGPHLHFEVRMNGRAVDPKAQGLEPR